MKELQVLEKKLLDAEQECVKRLAFIKEVKELHVRLTKLYASVAPEQDDAKVVWTPKASPVKHYEYKKKHQKMDVQGALRKHLHKDKYTPMAELATAVWGDKTIANKPADRDILYRRLSVVMSTIKGEGRLKHSRKLGWKLA